MDNWSSVSSPSQSDTAQDLTFSQQGLINTSVDPDPVIQGQARIQSKAVEILPRIDVDCAFLRIFVHVLYREIAFKINDRHIALYSGFVQSRCGNLAPPFA